jgi:hypothetical protein
MSQIINILPSEPHYHRPDHGHYQYNEPPPPQDLIMGTEWEVIQAMATILPTILIKGNKYRRYPGLNISNESNYNLWLRVNIDGNVTTSFPSVKISPGSNIDIPTLGRVYGIWEGTQALLTGYAQIIEFI